MDAITASQSPAIDGVLLFDLFSIRTSEPFLVMYGISAAFGYKPTADQVKLIRKNMGNRAIFEKWEKLGQEMKAGTRPFPEWLTKVEAVR
jgi:hypothetical protein